VIKLEKLDELTPEEIESLTPEEIAALIALFNDVTESMNKVFEVFQEMGEVILEAFKGFYIDETQTG
jgi:hypothetical protein